MRSSSIIVITGSTIASTGSISTPVVPRGSLSGRWNSSVSITPGYNTCTLTGVSRRSTWMHSAHAEMAAFVAAYAASAGGDKRAATDET